LFVSAHLRTVSGAGKFREELKVVIAATTEGYDVPGLRNGRNPFVLFDASLIDDILKLISILLTRALDLCRMKGRYRAKFRLILEGCWRSCSAIKGFGVMIFPDNIFTHLEHDETHPACCRTQV
jgi:hypothetical protein